MLYYSNAKINLGLNITQKREDGFHNIETIFYPIAVRDAIEFIPSSELSLTSSGIEIDCDVEDNLIIKAYRLLQNDFDLPTLRFHIHKTIPFGAGLAGGSANAAATLQELNRFYELGISENKLLEYANVLGSDCAFFIKNNPIYAEGKGDEMTPILLDLSAYYILLIYPQFVVSTKEAYDSVFPKQSEKSIQELIKKPITQWKGELSNDFENSVFGKYPILKDIKDKLYDKGALYASMSGSGSSVFGIFTEQPSLEHFSAYWQWRGKL